VFLFPTFFECPGGRWERLAGGVLQQCACILRLSGAAHRHEGAALRVNPPFKRVSTQPPDPTMLVDKRPLKNGTYPRWATSVVGMRMQRAVQILPEETVRLRPCRGPAGLSAAGGRRRALVLLTLAHTPTNSTSSDLVRRRACPQDKKKIALPAFASQRERCSHNRAVYNNLGLTCPGFFNSPQ